MSDENLNERSSPWMAIFLGIGIFAILAAMLLPGLRPHRPHVNHQISKCKNNIKQLGLYIQSYYSDGVSTAMPILKSFEVSTTNDGGFGFDAYMLTCPAEHLGLLYHYVWNPKLSGGKWADWNQPNSPLIWDASPHQVNDKVNVLFGDGHVEEMTPERLKELTR
jgi:prepilin-type processing-associated H-X9-DG protein